MTNKVTKYGIMIIAAVMLVAMAFAGAGAAATVVTTEDGLKTALAAGGEIKLGGDIDLSHSIIFGDGITPISATLDLNGHVLNQAADHNRIMTISRNANLKLTDSNPSTVHVFAYNKVGAWDYLPGASSADAIEIDAISDDTETGEHIIVRGGIATSVSRDLEGGDDPKRGGGAFLVTGSLEMDSGSLVGFALSNTGNSKRGGAVLIGDGTTGSAFGDAGSFVMKGTAQILGCHSGYLAGAIMLESTSETGLVLDDSAVIRYCHAPRNGGAVQVNGGTFTMYDGEISNCFALWGGGVLLTGSGSTFVMEGGKIINCHVDDVLWSITDTVIGGGVSVGSGTSFVMSGGEISNCHSKPVQSVAKYPLAGRGGGIFNDGSFSMSGGKITNCSASSSLGNGVYSAATFTISNTALIADDNDVYLDAGKTITVTSALSPTASIKAIKLSAYTDETEVVTVTYDGGTAFAVRNNFALQSSEKALKAIDYGGVHELVVADAESWSTYADTTWYNAQATEFTLTTPEQLAGLAELVNAGTDNFTGKTVKLANDIDLSGLDWTPIGSWSTSKAFSGTFDGQNHIISNYSMSLKSQNGVGLFGFIDKAELKNIVAISGDVIGKRFVGSVVGATRDSEITNIHVTIPEDVAVLGVEGVGGAIGRQIGGSDVISQIYVTMNGKVGADWSNTDSSGVGDMHSLIGGVIGWTCSDSVSVSDISIAGTGCVDGAAAIGGFLGKVQNGGTFSRIAVDLDVIGSSTGRIIGGAIGFNQAGTLHLSEISVSINDILGRADVGGCIGKLDSSHSDISNVGVHIVNMTGYLNNPGSGEPDTNVGGISGYVNANNNIISNVYSVIDTINLTTSRVKVGGICSSPNSLTIENSVSLVKRIIGSTTTSVGRIFNSEACVLENNYAWEGMLVYGNYVVDGSKSNSNGEDVSSFDFWNNQSFFSTTLGWDFDTVWKMNSGNDKYRLPVLKWQITPVLADASYLVPTSSVIADANNVSTFGYNNASIVRSTAVSSIVLESVNNVTGLVNFTVDNTSGIAATIPTLGMNRVVVSVFDIDATNDGSSAKSTIYLNATLANLADKDMVKFFHYTVGSGWDSTPLTSTIVAEYPSENKVLYKVETDSFSPFGVGIYTALPPQYTPSSSRNTGSTIILQEGQVAPNQQPTVAPTVAPTAAPTEKPAAPTVAPTAKPTAQQTQQSPAPVLGLIAGLGVAGLIYRLRK